MDALSAPDRLKLEAARSIREDFLHQNAYNEVDTYTNLNKQFRMMELLCGFYDITLEALQQGANIEKLVGLPVRERIGRFKYIEAKDIEKEYEDIIKTLHHETGALIGKEDA